jgi:hypothetical protein
MATFFNPTPEERKALEDIARGVPGVQNTLVANHAQLTRPDRGAHQQQLAASTVRFEAAGRLPKELDGLGIFQHGAAGRHLGIGRISTGLGCPHAETDPDFLGLMVAFTTAAGRRIDFITINDPTSPTDTPEEFLALLRATADAAGTANMFAQQAKLLVSLAKHAGLKAPAIGIHVTGQTARTRRSSSAFPQYWTGIVRARDVLGKFTFVPTAATATGHDVARGPKHLSEDWRARQGAGPLEFRLEWIRFLRERETPVNDLTKPWQDGHRVVVGTVTFPKSDPTTREARLTALLASELGANAGNWDEVPDGPRAALPATRFTAARSLAYRESQKHRDALPESAYAAFFTDGAISDDLSHELIRRYRDKRAAGHWVPDLGEF